MYIYYKENKYGWKVRSLGGVCWIIVFIFIKIYDKYFRIFVTKILNINVLYTYYTCTVIFSFSYFSTEYLNVNFLNMPNYIRLYTYRIVHISYFSNYGRKCALCNIWKYIFVLYNLAFLELWWLKCNGDIIFLTYC